MNSQRNLLENVCGQPNALVSVGRQMFQDANSGQARTFLGPFRPTTGAADELAIARAGRVREPAPTTFSMSGLLDEVNRMDAGDQWTNEFLSSNHAPSRSQEWAQEFLTNDNTTGPAMNAIFDQVWQQQAAEPASALKWSADYLTEAENAIFSDRGDSFSSFQPLGGSNEAEEWSNKYLKFAEEMEQAGAGLGDADHLEAAYGGNDISRTAENYWQNFENEWANVAGKSDADSWLAEYGDLTSVYKNYNMSTENPYAQVDDPLSLGKQFLSQGDLANAVLCFEAAVQRDSGSSEGWLSLSRAQAENEQETRAIAAANKCLEIDPKNMDALEILATAYANESLFDACCKALAQWLDAHPKYNKFAPADIASGKQRTVISAFIDRSLFNEVESAYLNAARSDSSNVDPDLQNCLGVLYNVIGDTDRAVDCFQTALMIRPTDARLWNRVGATLANGGRSAEAVAAYRRALDLYPGYIRARYNLGISCLNLSANKEAIDHFLSALNLQMRGVGPKDDQGIMSDNIWKTLRVAMAGFGRDDWLNLVDNRNLSKLSEVFSISTGADSKGSNDAQQPSQ